MSSASSRCSSARSTTSWLFSADRCDSTRVIKRGPAPPCLGTAEMRFRESEMHGRVVTRGARHKFESRSRRTNQSTIRMRKQRVLQRCRMKAYPAVGAVKAREVLHHQRWHNVATIEGQNPNRNLLWTAKRRLEIQRRRYFEGYVLLRTCTKQCKKPITAKLQVSSSFTFLTVLGDSLAAALRSWFSGRNTIVSKSR